MEQKQELLKVAKPILFNSKMVRAILEGKKTATSRVLNPNLKEDEYGYNIWFNEVFGRYVIEKYDDDESDFNPPRYINPPYEVGDILYVRETWRIGAWNEDISSIAIDYKADGFCRKEWVEIESNEAFEKYWIQSTDDAIKAKIECKDGVYNWNPSEAPTRWRPSIHMPKNVARIILEILNVKVQMLKETTEDQAHKEGFNNVVEFIEEFLRIYPEKTIDDYIFMYEFGIIKYE